MTKEKIVLTIQAALRGSKKIKIVFRQESEAARTLTHLIGMESIGFIQLENITDNGMLDLMEARDTGIWNHDDIRTVTVTLINGPTESWFAELFENALEKIEVVD